MIHSTDMRSALLVMTFGLLVGFRALAEDDYFPLHVGDEWTMTASVQLKDGQVFEGALMQRTESTIERNGKAYFRIRTWTEGLPRNTDQTQLLRRGDSAIYSIEETLPTAVETIDFELPLKIGAEWSRIEKGKKQKVAVIGVEDTEVLGRKYKDCYRILVSCADNSYVVNLWLAPNLGSVRSEIVHKNGVTMTFLTKAFRVFK